MNFKVIRLNKSFSLIMGIILLLLIFTYPAIGALVKENQPLMKYQVPDSWRKIDLDKETLDTDISLDIILRAFEPAKGNLLLVTDFSLEDEFTSSQWLNAMKEAFSGDKNIKIIREGIEKIGKNEVVSLALLGIGNGTKFDEKGKVKTIRHTFLIPNGNEITQFILICPETQYSKLLPAIRNIVGTLTLEEKVAKVTSPPTPVKKKEIASPIREEKATPAELTKVVTIPSIPIEEQDKLSAIDLLRIKLSFLENGILVFNPEVRNNLCDMVIMTPSSKKAYRAKILTPEVEGSPSEYNLTWSIPDYILNTVDLLIFLREDKQVGWIAPLEDIRFIAKWDKDKNELSISSSTKLFGGLTFSEYLDKRFSNYIDVLK